MSRKHKPMTRSQNMAKIKSKNTKPEIYLRKLLYNLGIRYRVNYSELEGKPDIYISKYKTAIFVNGCFWHRHENCKLASKPKKNTEFWENKFKKNIERDRRNYSALSKFGIKVIIVWQCEIYTMMKNENYRNTALKSIITEMKRQENDSLLEKNKESKIAETTEKYEEKNYGIEK